MTTAALGDPKLREYIAAFLHDSYADLKSWALLSTSFTPSAQKHQFHHITLTKRPRCFAACYRLCAVLTQSPHLVPLVHNLDAIVDTVVLMQLSGLHFLNLQELFLQGDLSSAVEENPIASASVLIALPRLRSLRLKDVIFSDMSGLARLFGSASPQLESLSLQYVHFESATTCEYDDAHVIPRRPHIKSIHLANPARQMIDWFLRPHCPLDFSQLHDTDIVVSEMTADNVQLLEGVRLSLQRLTFRAIPRAPLGADTLSTTLDLGRFPALKILVIDASDRVLSRIFTILRSLTSDNGIHALTLNVYSFDNNTDLLSPLTSIPFPVLRSLNISVRRLRRPLAPADEMADTVRGVLAPFEERGVLSVTIL